MSFVFDVGEDTVWSPSLRIGQTYVGIAEAIGEVARVDTGLKAVANDYYDIEIDDFERFVRTLLRDYLASDHSVLHALTHGFLATSLVLLERAGRAVDASELTEGSLRASVAALSADMPDL